MIEIRKMFAMLALSAANIALVGCGGGGSGGSSSAPAPSPTPAPAPTPTPAPAPATYSVGGTITGLTGTLQLLDNGTDQVTVTAASTFTFPTSLPSGANFSVAIGTQPAGQTCTVSNGTGVVTANVSTVAVSCTTSQASGSGYSYLLDAYGIIHQFSVALNGTLSPLATPTATTGGAPLEIRASSNGSFVYALSGGNQATLYQYSVGSSGQLVPLGVATAALADTPDGYPLMPNSFTINPAGSIIYFAGANYIQGYSLNSDGTLGSVVTTLNIVQQNDSGFVIVFNKSGTAAYVLDEVHNAIFQYTVNSDGSLVAMATASIPTDAEPGRLIIDPSGQHLYALNFSSISQYTIGTSGALTAMSPANVATDGTTGIGETWAGSASDLAFDSTGAYLYAGLSNGNQIARFIINSDGSLSLTSSTLQPTIPTVVSGQSGYITQLDGTIFFDSRFNLAFATGVDSYFNASTNQGTFNTVAADISIGGAGQSTYGPQNVLGSAATQTPSQDYLVIDAAFIN